MTRNWYYSSSPAGLRVWARRVRAEARGGNGNGLLGWCRKALSTYTWCRTNKGLQNEWLFKMEVMTGTHVVEECPELDQWRPRRAVWREWKEASGGRAVSKKEEEEDLLGAFFYRIYEFLFSFPNPPPIIHRPLVPARYAIKFVPSRSDVSNYADVSSFAPAVVVSSPVGPVADVQSSATSVISSTDCSVVPSANFVPAYAFTSPCIGTTH